MNEIRNAFTKITPHKLDDIKEELKTRDDNIVVETKKKKKRYLFAVPVVALCMVLMVMFLPATGQVQTVVGLDVNPSVELNLDDDYKILEVKTNNEDGKKIVGDMDLTGSDVEVGVNALIGAMLKEGYIDELKNSLLVSVTGENEAENEKLRQQLSLNIDELLKASDINGSIVSQTIADKSIEELAKQYQISVGKAEIIQQLVSKNSLYTFESLKDLSIHELNLLLQSNQVEQVTITGSASESGYIGKEKAQSIAVADANVSNPTILKVEMDYDDGMMVYEVDFHKNGVEYEYEINALTGEIVKKETDGQARTNQSSSSTSQQGSQSSSNASSNASSNTSNGQISQNQAKTIAKNHAGVQSVSQEKIKKDYDDGVTKYEYEFVSGNYKYEYDINAQTGSVIKHEKEYVGQVNISKDQAKQKALSHANVSASNAYDVEVELDNQYYEVSFKSGKYEYEYRIKASDGSIVSHEKDYDD